MEINNKQIFKCKVDKNVDYCMNYSSNKISYELINFKLTKNKWYSITKDYNYEECNNGGYINICYSLKDNNNNDIFLNSVKFANYFYSDKELRQEKIKNILNK